MNDITKSKTREIIDDFAGGNRKIKTARKSKR